MHTAEPEHVRRAKSEPTAHEDKSDSVDSRPQHASKSRFWAQHEADARGVSLRESFSFERACRNAVFQLPTEQSVVPITLRHSDDTPLLPACRKHQHPGHTGYEASASLYRSTLFIDVIRSVPAAALPTTYWARELEVDRTDWNLYLRYCCPCYISLQSADVHSHSG